MHDAAFCWAERKTDRNKWFGCRASASLCWLPAHRAAESRPSSPAFSNESFWLQVYSNNGAIQQVIQPADAKPAITIGFQKNAVFATLVGMAVIFG
jgi:hypothetical protein